MSVSCSTWLASPDLETSSPVSDTSVHSLLYTLTHFTSFHLGSLLWSFAVHCGEILQLCMAPAAKLCWSSICACDLAGFFFVWKKGGFAVFDRKKLLPEQKYLICSVLQFFHWWTYLLCTYPCSCPAQDWGEVWAHRAGQRVHSQEMMQRLLRRCWWKVCSSSLQGLTLGRFHGKMDPKCSRATLIH